jgi:hypothetical protein
MWQIFNIKKVSNSLDETLNYFGNIIGEVQKQHPNFSIDFDLPKGLVDSRQVKVDFSITQSNIGDVLEPNFEYNYNIESYMGVGVTLLEIIEKIKNK